MNKFETEISRLWICDVCVCVCVWGKQINELREGVCVCLVQFISFPAADQQVLQHVTWCCLQMHLLHLVQVADDLFFRPVHNQHTPLLLVELVAAVAMAVSVVSVRAATVVCNSATMAAAAAVRGGAFSARPLRSPWIFPAPLRTTSVCMFFAGSRRDPQQWTAQKRWRQRHRCNWRRGQEATEGSASYRCRCWPPTNNQEKKESK